MDNIRLARFIRRKALLLIKENQGHIDGEINATQLAVDIACEFDCTEWLDDQSHIVWKIATKVAREVANEV